MSASAPDTYLGIDLGGTSVKLGICDGRGAVRAHARIATEVERGSDYAIARITHAARALIDSTATVAACGIGVPGEIDIGRRLLVRANHFPGWSQVALAERIGDNLGVPSALENDANCAAWGEFRAGVGVGTT